MTLTSLVLMYAASADLLSLPCSSHVTFIVAVCFEALFASRDLFWLTWLCNRRGVCVGRGKEIGGFGWGDLST
jgi:hypothetical protein